MDLEILKQIWPEWQIEEKPLGKGSYGIVYKAVRQDHNVESLAAIKVIPIPTDPYELDVLRSEGMDIEATQTYLQNIVNDFVSEIQLMESLKGAQNIVSVEDYKVVEKVEELGWYICIRMELLIPFNTYIRNKKMTEDEVIKLGCDICTALEMCSKRNIIHRDIKPENIFVNDFGDFKLGDFGIARKLENLTSGLSQKGTFYYMAPEVATRNDYDVRADIYSLGIVLYRLLNGNMLPFLNSENLLLNSTERSTAVNRRLRGEELTAPSEASPAMADLILRACAYDSNMRFSSATEMKQALMSVANGTYHMIYARDFDRTIPVCKSPVDYERTMSVRRASVSSALEAGRTLNSSGSASKKKSKLPAILAAFFAVIILAGTGIFAVSKLNAHNTNSTPHETFPESTSNVNTPVAISISSPSPSVPPEPLSLSICYDDLSNYEKLNFSGAKATSELIYSGELFRAVYAIDGDLDSTWQEGAEGLGIGESLTLYFPSEEAVNIIEIYPGFISSDYVFENNGRPKSLKFEFSDGSSCTFDFEDKRGGVVLKLSETVITDSICITILDAYDAPWEDTAIAEVAAYR